jgi:hypothetical protein
MINQAISLNFKQIKTGSAIILLAFMAGCANIVAPTGGPRDTTPPKILRVEPANFSANFTGDKINLVFNEFIQLKDLNKYLIISPPMEKTPDIEIKGKSLAIKLNEKLLDNTTYCLFFGNAIVDLTENNPIQNFQYVFSTGSYLDSMSLTGNVISAPEIEPAKGVLVCLYDKDEDSLPFKEKPRYVTKSGENGQFELRNLGNRKYKLVAIHDKNNDYLFQPASEDIAFSDSLVGTCFIRTKMSNDSVKKDSLNKPANLSQANLVTFKEFDTSQKLLKKEYSKPGQFTFIFKQPAKSPMVKPIGKYAELGSAWAIPEFLPHGDTLIYWLTGDSPGDSITLLISEDQKIIDTVSFDVKKFERNSKYKKIYKSGKILYTVNTSGAIELNQNLNFEFSYPLLKFDLSAIRLIEDKDTLVPEIHLDSVKRHLVISHKWKEAYNYHVLIPKNTLKDLKGQENDTILLQLKSKALKDYAVIKLHCKPSQSGQYIVQLISDKNLVERQKKFQSESLIEFDFVKPANYRLRIIFDKNRNGKWDSGKYLKKIQPEIIRYFPRQINARGNWEIEEELKF